MFGRRPLLVWTATLIGLALLAFWLILNPLGQAEKRHTPSEPSPYALPNGWGFVYGAARPKCYVILGERVSGTQLIFNMLSRTFDVEERLVVWKHSFASDAVVEQLHREAKECLVFFVTRNPYAWLNQLWASPHHIEGWTYAPQKDGRAYSVGTKRSHLDWLHQPYDCRTPTCDQEALRILQCRLDDADKEKFQFQGRQTWPCDVTLTESVHGRLGILDVRRWKVESLLAYGAGIATWFEHVAYEAVADSQSAKTWLQRIHEVYGFPLKGNGIDTSFMDEIHFHASTQIATGQVARERNNKRKALMFNRCYLKDLVYDKAGVHDAVVAAIYEGLKPTAHLEAALGYTICPNIEGVAHFRPEVECTFNSSYC